MDDAQLQQVVKLLVGETQTLGGQVPGTGMNWRASGADVVLDAVWAHPWNMGRSETGTLEEWP